MHNWKKALKLSMKEALSGFHYWLYVEANETEDAKMDSNIQDLLIGKMRED